MSLYEGTNGVQAMDLMGRKMTGKNGAAYAAYKAEIERFLKKHQDHPELGHGVRTLAGAAKQLWTTAEEMKGRMKTDPLQWASYTYPGLMAFSEVTMAWRLLDMALIAYEPAQKEGDQYDFYRGKIFQATYFVDTTLPHTVATMETCLRQGREIVNIPDIAF
jgi:hypothetical protein